MGFKTLIKYKRTGSLIAALMLSGTQLVMADTAAAATPAADANADMWMGVAYYTLLFLLACIAVAIIGKILKVYDLTLKLQGKKGIKWNNFMGSLYLAFLIAGLYGAYWSFTVQGNMILPESASVHGVKIDEMMAITFGITVVVFVITQILLFGFAFKYKGSDDRKAYFYPHNNTIEKIWTVIPAIVLTVLVVFGFFTWKTITNSTDVKGDINIEVTGHQFAWELRYPGKDGKLGPKNFHLITANNKLGINYQSQDSFDDLRADTMVLPLNASIRLNITAQDVIHSVFMPHFRLQLNAVPGLPTFFKFVPTITTEGMRQRLADPKFEYKLYCAKICGGGHYNMQIIVRVVSQAEYQKWILQQKPYLTDDLKKDLKLVNTSTTTAGAQNKIALNN